MNDKLIEDFFDDYTINTKARNCQDKLAGQIYIPASEVLRTKEQTHIYLYHKQQYNKNKSIHKTIHRMKFQSPMQGDVFYLRLLLRHFPSTSFEDCKTFNGKTYPNCNEACIARGLVSNNDEFTQALTEAVNEKFHPKRVRHLFAFFLSHGMIDALKQLDTFAYALTIDLYGFINMKPPTDPDVKFEDIHPDVRRILLRELDSILKVNGHRLGQYGLPEPIEGNTIEFLRAKEEQLKEENIEELKEWMATITLTDDQQAAFDYVIKHPQQNVYIDGPSGRGKSLLLDYIVAHYRAQGKVIVVTAPTGVVAIARRGGGSTVHSTWNVTLKPDDKGRQHCNVDNNSQRATYLRQSDDRAIDEAPMLNSKVYMAIARCESEINNNTTRNMDLLQEKRWILAGN